MIFWSKILTSLVFNESVTDRRADGRTDGPTDGRMDKLGYRDARPHLKTTKDENSINSAEHQSPQLQERNMDRIGRMHQTQN